MARSFTTDYTVTDLYITVTASESDIKTDLHEFLPLAKDFFFYKHFRSKIEKAV